MTSKTIPNTTCKICNSASRHIFNAEILSKYDVKYYICHNCGFLHTEEPFWLDEAYNFPIALADTGILTRNQYISKVASVIIYFLFNKNAKFLDYGGGYGIFTRLMRDYGFDFYWTDLYAENLVAKGFDYKGGCDIELVTTFETFEHFTNPIEEINSILEITKNVFFTTELLPDPIPTPDDWWYYSTTQGQHISFYSKNTLRFLAQKYGLNLCSYKRFHLLTSRKISPLYFKAMIKLTNYGLFGFVKKMSRGKTVSDMEAMT